ncbi:hypothetical protein [Neobacillus sp. D3-1R]|uniref:hypothetical protein n=1 Tax=Neobacillus sp. D3-1R TaxID=3445778 RepID=UPI003FA037A0
MSDHNSKLFVLGVIFLIGGFPLSLVVINLIQSSFFQPESFLIFSAQKSSYFIFTGSLLLLLLGVGLIINKNSKVIMGFGVIVFSAAIVFLFLSFYNYTYFDEKGIHINKTFSFNEVFYSWDKVESVTQLNKNGQPSKIEFKFDTNNDMFLYSIDSKWFSKRTEFNQLVRDHNIEFGFRDLE